jgi:hypothetical protein
MSSPYSEFRGTKTWQALSRAITALERNRDVVLQTKKEYVIGYLASKLPKTKSVVRKPKKSRSRPPENNARDVT